MIAYHGSKEYTRFSSFKKSNHGLLGPGIYFTINKLRAMTYATKDFGTGNLYSVDLDIKNPLVITGNFSNPACEILSNTTYQKRKQENENINYLIKDTDIEKLKRHGYDAIILADEVMVFSNKQINILEVNYLK